MKALQPYLKYVELFQKGMGVPRREELKKMADVYDKTLKDKALPKTNIGCAPCVKNMMNRIQGAINRGEFKQAKKEKIVSHKEYIINTDINLKKGVIEINPKSLKWGELKSYAKEKGINTKGMKKAEILKELGC